MDYLKQLNSFSNHQEAYNFWKSNPPTYYSIGSTSLAGYDTTKILLDTKWVSICTSIQKLDECVDALERLTIHKATQYTHCNTFVGKLESYIKVLPHKKLIQLPSQPIQYFKSTNPFIIRNKETDEFLINVRHVNYYCDLQNQYHCNKPGETIVHTKNFLYFMDKELSLPPKKVMELRDHTTFCKFPSPVQDLEDVRLVYREQQRLWCTATSREILSSTSPQIVLCEVNYPDKEIKNGLRLLCHDSGMVDNVQKNWLPFTHPSNNKLMLLYSTGPNLIIYEMDEWTGKCQPYIEHPTYCSFQQTRGGSPPIPFNIPKTPVAWLYTVHYAYDRPNIRRIYFHRFIFLSETFEPLFASESFTLFEEHAIEFVLSACESASGDSIYLGVGRNDVEAYII